MRFFSFFFFLILFFLMLFLLYKIVVHKNAIQKCKYMGHVSFIYHVYNGTPRSRCVWRHGCVDYFGRNMLDFINYVFIVLNCLKEEK